MSIYRIFILFFVFSVIILSCKDIVRAAHFIPKGPLYDIVGIAERICSEIYGGYHVRWVFPKSEESASFRCGIIDSISDNKSSILKFLDKSSATKLCELIGMEMKKEGWILHLFDEEKGILLCVDKKFT